MKFFLFSCDYTAKLSPVSAGARLSLAIISVPVDHPVVMTQCNKEEEKQKLGIWLIHLSADDLIGQVTVMLAFHW